MGTLIKNGKLLTNNIFTGRLIILIILMINISAYSETPGTGKKWVIVIDAGHGGKDPGARGAFSSEKNITLPITLKTGEYIEKNIKNVTVIYTRKTDKFVDLKERANIANKNHADLFISIHANWAKSKNIKGTETFIMGLAKDQENLEVAMKENEVILLENDYSTKYEEFDPKSPESYIMFSLMQNIYQEQSTGLAAKIQTQYKEKIARIDRGVKQAGFWVLYMTTMPSVLTEIGFITHPAEEKFLNSNEGQDYIASAIFRACREYINDIDSKSNRTFEVQKTDPVKQLPTAEKISSEAIVFMVQIATSSTKMEINPGNFKGLTDIVEIIEQKRFKYATGNFSEYSGAANYRKKIETFFPDSFVIAVKDNKILPLQQALEHNKSNKSTK